VSIYTHVFYTKKSALQAISLRIRIFFLFFVSQNR